MNFEPLPNVRFNLIDELTHLIGEERMRRVISSIDSNFHKYEFLKPISLAFSGDARFNANGILISDFNHKEEYFNYRIEFESIFVSNKKSDSDRVIKISYCFN